MKKGFTLIELMIVIAVIAILASIIIPNISRARARAQLSACMENMKAFLTAAQMYQVDHPVPEGVLYDFDPADASFTGPSPVIPDYLGSNPVCPSLGYADYGMYIRNDQHYHGALVYCHYSGTQDSPHFSVTNYSTVPFYADLDGKSDSGYILHGYYNVGGDTNWDVIYPGG